MIDKAFKYMMLTIFVLASFVSVSIASSQDKYVYEISEVDKSFNPTEPFYLNEVKSKSSNITKESSSNSKVEEDSKVNSREMANTLLLDLFKFGMTLFFIILVFFLMGFISLLFLIFILPLWKKFIKKS